MTIATHDNKTQIEFSVIGAGGWGINHVRTLHKLFPENISFVFDPDVSRKEAIEKISKDLILKSDFHESESAHINAVVVATPAATHFEVARHCLNAGKHVLVEKPIALYSSQARELHQLATSKGLTLMVGHLLLFHPAIVRIKQFIEDGELGRLHYLYSNRLNLGKLRQEENILWSFAPHDIAIFDYLIESEPTEVHSFGGMFVQQGIHDVTVTHLSYPENIKAHIHVSWLHPFKEHRLVVIGEKSMIVFQDNAEGGELLVYDKGYDVLKGVPAQRNGVVDKLEFDSDKPLEKELLHFAECIKEKKRALVDGEHALRVLTVLENAQKSLLSHEGE